MSRNGYLIQRNLLFVILSVSFSLIIWNCTPIQQFEEEFLKFNHNSEVRIFEFSQVKDAAMSPDGNTLAVLEREQSCLYSVSGLIKLEQMYCFDTVGGEYIYWSPDQAFILISYQGSIELRDLQSRQTIAKANVQSPYAPEIVWSSTGDEIAISVPMPSSESNNYIAEVYSIPSLDLQYQIPRNEGVSDTINIAWNDRQNTMVLSGRTDFFFYEDGNTIPYNLQATGLAGDMAVFWVSEEEYVLISNEINFWKEDELEKNRVRILLVDQDNIIGEYQLSEDGYEGDQIILSADYDEESQLLVTYSMDGTLRLFHLVEQEIILLDSYQVTGMEYWTQVRMFKEGTGIYLYDSNTIQFLSFINDSYQQ